MAEELKKGDVVFLKSGGPMMTIHNIGDYTHHGVTHGALCVWFDGAKRVEAVFELETLERDDR